MSEAEPAKEEDREQGLIKRSTYEMWVHLPEGKVYKFKFYPKVYLESITI